MLDTYFSHTKIFSVSGVLNAEELAQIEAWYPSVTDVADEKLLAAEGEREHFELSQRLQARYPNLLPSVFDNDTYLVILVDFKYMVTQELCNLRNIENNERFGKKVAVPQNSTFIKLSSAFSRKWIVLGWVGNN